MTDDGQLAGLAARLHTLEAQEAMRHTMARYLDLCDVPSAAADPETVLAELAQLFTPRAIWEGIGPEYTGKFGRTTGRHQVARKVGGYLPPNRHFARNAHLLGSEQLRVDGDRGHGQWLMQQLSSYDPSVGSPDDLLCARLTIDFDLSASETGCTALIRHFRTQRLFAAALGPQPAPHDDTARPKEQK